MFDFFDEFGWWGIGLTGALIEELTENENNFELNENNFEKYEIDENEDYS